MSSAPEEPQSDSAASAASDESAPKTTPVRPRRNLYAWVLAFTVFLLALVPVFQLGGFLGDNANVNVACLILIFLAVLVNLMWFVWLSGYSHTLRISVAVLTVVVLAVAVAILKIDDVSGELVPSFRFRWQPARDRQLAAPQTEAMPVDLASTTNLDFPQFLGPQRSGSVETIRVYGDWASRPPKLVWRRPIGAGWSAFAAVNGYAVTMEQRGDDELVTCYEVFTGKPCWSHAIKGRHATLLGGVGPRSTPTIHEGNVYALGATGVLRCLDGSNGRALWTVNLLEQFGIAPGRDGEVIAWGRAASPLIVDDLVVVPAGGPAEGPSVSLAAFHKDTGALVWRGGNSQISYSSPIITMLAGRPQIVIVNESSVSGHHPATGQPLWSHPWPGSSHADANTSQPVVLSPEQMLISKGYGKGAAKLRLQPAGEEFEVEVEWQKPVLKTKLTSAIAYQGFAYGLSDGSLECVDLSTGRRKWRQPRKGRYEHGQILRVRDRLLVITESGQLALVALTPDQHQELGRMPALQGKTWNNLCLYGRFVLVRNAEQAACFELPLDETGG